MSNKSVSKIVIVGGGSAGWLIAGLLASEHGANAKQDVSITLVESPDVKAIGVGEGSWPTMQRTLQQIGLSESVFLARCSASFKQGTKFVDWLSADRDHHYYHPFTVPVGYGEINLVPYWQEQRDKVTFANAVGVQAYLCDRNLAPKQITTPEYAYVANYAYHLDAGKFAELLKEHCTQKLGVKHVLDHVTGVNGDPDSDINSLSTTRNGDIEGDLFVDCTGFASLLLGQHYKIPLVEKREVLFNDSALAIQVPYVDEDSPIASQTVSTARSAGWIWDIGLTNRRGVGYTYSSAHTNDDAAQAVLRQYVETTTNGSVKDIEPRKISFEPGHRQKFWHKNCVAVGMSAGFLEPLEASALVLVELAGQMISEELPVNRGVMDIIARRFNEKFLYRWDRVIDFLKLHYVLSQRADSAYWIDNRDTGSIPESLRDKLELWKYLAPWHNDFSQVDEIFSAASYQYVLYGMGFETQVRKTVGYSKNAEKALQLFIDNHGKANRIIGKLPTNRDLLTRINQNRPRPL